MNGCGISRLSCAAAGKRREGFKIPPTHAQEMKFNLNFCPRLDFTLVSSLFLSSRFCSHFISPALPNIVVVAAAAVPANPVSTLSMPTAAEGESRGAAERERVKGQT